MPLTILSDAQITSLLDSLTLPEAERFRAVMEGALKEYSTGCNLAEGAGAGPRHGHGVKMASEGKEEDEGEQEEKDGGGASSGVGGAARDGMTTTTAAAAATMVKPLQQAPRTSVKNPVTGGTSLFMPSILASSGLAVKVVTLLAPPAATSSTTTTITSHPSSPPGAPGAAESTISTRPTGALTLFTSQGQPLALLHAQTLTAFRTALASMCLFVRRTSRQKIAVFGTGEQAYWHVRLALLFSGIGDGEEEEGEGSGGGGARGKRGLVTVINVKQGESAVRSAERLVARLRGKKLPGRVDFSVLTPWHDPEKDGKPYASALRRTLRDADVIFCCTPAIEPLFDAEMLLPRDARRSRKKEKKEKGRLVVAVGSYQRHMREVPGAVLRQAVGRKEGGGRGTRVQEGGVLVVDSVEGAMEEAGEVWEASLREDEMIELGELLPLLPSNQPSTTASSHQKTQASPSDDEKDAKSPPSSSAECNTQDEDYSDEEEEEDKNTKSNPATFLAAKLALLRHGVALPSALSSEESSSSLYSWLSTGNVVYKSVGVGVMDLAVGKYLAVEFAREKGVGTTVLGF